MTEFYREETVSVRDLVRPFPKQAIEKRDGGRGTSFDYVGTETVIRRLNQATGNQWSFRITNTEWRPWRNTAKGDPQELLIVYGELTIPGLGTRSGTGVQIINPSGGEDMVKGAASDCLKKCAVSFGVGIDLYGPDLEAGELPQQPAPQQRQQPAPAQQPTETRDQRIDRIVRALSGTLTTSQYNVILREVEGHQLGDDEHIAALIYEAEQRREAARAKQASSQQQQLTQA